MDDHLDEEMRQHIEERAAELMREGLGAEEAHDRARREFGNVSRLAEESRDVWRRPTTDEIWRALVHAVRSLRRGGAYTVVSIVTLALGIGVNTAIFSIIDAALLRGLPFKNPGRLVRAGFPMLGTSAVVVDPEYVAWRNENHSFDGLVAYNGTEYTLTGAGEPERLTARTVPFDFLSVLGIRPAAGRDFSKGDDTPGSEVVALDVRGAPPVALISDSLWSRRWNRDPSIIGRSIMLDKDPVTVIGILPPNFLIPGEADLLVPAKLGEKPNWNANGMGLLQVIGRLKPGVTPESGAADLERISRTHASDKPVFLANAQKGKHVVVYSLANSLLGDVRPALLVLISAVGVILLIACANVAALQLSRFNGRRRELGVRAALGASRGQLIRLVLVEALLLSVTGAAVGCVAAYVLIRSARPFYALLHLANPGMIALNVDVACYAFAVTVLCALLFAIGPATLASRTDPQSALRDGGARAVPGLRNTVRGVLVTAEMALAVLLLLGAGLLLRSFARLMAVDPGFETRGILTASMTRKWSSPNPEDSKNAEFVSELMTRLASAPGLVAAGAASSPPFSAYNLGARISIEGHPSPLLDGRGTPIIAVTPGYFRALGIPILAGQDVSDSDLAGRPRVAVVNVAFAQEYFPGEDPMGRRFRDGPNRSDQPWTTIVGVVASSHHEDLSKAAVPEIFVPFSQRPLNRITVTLRTTGQPELMSAFLREQVHAIDPDQPLYDVSTMEARMDRTVRNRKLETVLLGSFAALALLLAAAGVYGVMSYSVTQSTREVGVRMALGATQLVVTGEVLSSALKWSATGIAVGMAVGWYLTRFLAGFLYGVGAKDPLTFSLAPTFLLAIALIASFLPARRASQIDPLEALRAE
jgi:putative ABC transport system permease protein